MVLYTNSHHKNVEGKEVRVAPSPILGTFGPAPVATPGVVRNAKHFYELLKLDLE